MDISGYNLRQRSVAIFTQSLTFTTAPTADSLAIASAGSGVSSAPTMASLCQENLGSDSGPGIDTVAESITLTAASPVEILTVVNAASTVLMLHLRQMFLILILRKTFIGFFECCHCRREC